MKCACWQCENEAVFGQKHCGPCSRGCHHAIPTERRRVDLLVASPAYQSAVDKLLKHVKPGELPEFTADMTKLLMLAVDHGISMAEK